MKTVRLTVAGSGDAFGSGGRLNTCFYVESHDINFLIDCGASVLPGLKKNHIKPHDIDLIFITHFHGDHYGGLPFFLLESAIYNRGKELSIISPPGCKEKVTQLLDLLYPGTEVLQRLNIRFISYSPLQTLKEAGVTVKAFPVNHSHDTLPHGLRIGVGKKIISYSGDTSWTENLIPLSEGADLFICECNFFEREAKGHLNYRIVKEKVAALNCKQLLLTHFDDEMLNNLDNVSLKCASDGMIIEL